MSEAQSFRQQRATAIAHLMEELGYVTVAEAGQLTGYTPRHVRRLIERGALKALGHGRGLRVSLSSIRDYNAEVQDGA
jgi:excisionase family DNA binding protein